MDYAAALRAAPSGPAVKLDTTPAAKQVASKPAPKPTKVVAVEHAPIVEEDVVSSVAVAAAPAKPPTNAGLSPVVRFVINVPHSGSNANVKESASTENNADDSDSSDNADEEATGDVSANGAKSNPSKDAKTHNFSAQDLENNFSHLSELVSVLEKHAEERTWELEGGFRFSRGNKSSGGAKTGASLHDLEFPTVGSSLKWLTIVIELLRSKSTSNVAIGGGAFLHVVRVEDQIRVIRSSNSTASASKEVWLQFDDVVLEVREQAKAYLAVVNRIEQVLERREAQLADKLRKDAAQRRKAISTKLQTAPFTTMLDTLHSLLSGVSAEFPALSKRFRDQEAHLAQQRRRVKEENQDMLNLFFASIPASLLETNLKHITTKLEPVVEESTNGEKSGEESSSSAPSTSTSAASSASTVPGANKKLSKKEQAAVALQAANAEADRKKAADAALEAQRKEAERVRREKAEKIALVQAEAKKKQAIANPFTHLEGFSETASAALEAEAEEAKAKVIARTAEAKVKQEKEAAEEARLRDAKQASDAKAKLQKVSAVSQENMAKREADDARQKQAKVDADKKKQQSREADQAKKAAADKQTAEKQAAEKRKQEKADRLAAEKATADKKKRDAAAEHAKKQEEYKKLQAEKAEKNASSSSAAAASNASGPDRSEKTRKQEKIDHEKKEKARKQEIKTKVSGGKKKSDNTTIIFAASAVGVLIIVLVIYFATASTTTPAYT